MLNEDEKNQLASKQANQFLPQFILAFYISASFVAVLYFIHVLVSFDYEKLQSRKQELYVSQICFDSKSLSHFFLYGIWRERDDKKNESEEEINKYWVGKNS